MWPWYVYSNLFGSSSRVISGAFGTVKSANLFQKKYTAESQITCEVEGGGGWGVGEVAIHRDLLTTAQF